MRIGAKLSAEWGKGMDRNRNYARELDKIIARWKEMDEAREAEQDGNGKPGESPGRKLLLHSCCAFFIITQTSPGMKSIGNGWKNRNG